MTSKAQATKEKIDKLDLIKMKTCCALKDTINRLKQQTTEYEKVTYLGIYKKLISRLYREL